MTRGLGIWYNSSSLATIPCLTSGGIIRACSWVVVEVRFPVKALWIGVPCYRSLLRLFFLIMALY